MLLTAENQVMEKFNNRQSRSQIVLEKTEPIPCDQESMIKRVT